MSNLVDGSIQHDTVTRFLSGSNFTSKDLWTSVKSLVREHQNTDGCLIFDDTIIEKSFTDENDLISWHWDHSKHRSTKRNQFTECFLSHTN